MKKIFAIAVFILISFQAFSYGEIRYFSREEIYQIIESSLPLNPQIKNKHLVYQGDIFGYIIDNTRVSILIQKGDNLTSILERGIPEDFIKECKLMGNSLLISDLMGSPRSTKNENKPEIDNTISILLSMGTAILGFSFIIVVALFFKGKKKK